MGETIPLMIIFQGPVPVLDKNKWLHISGFTAVLDLNPYGSNDGAGIIKHYHCVLKPWLQTINVSASSDRKVLMLYANIPHILKTLYFTGLLLYKKYLN